MFNRNNKKRKTNIFNHSVNHYDQLIVDRGVEGGFFHSDSVENAFLPNKLTNTQRDSITPTSGNIIYNTTTNVLQLYNGTSWKNIDHQDGGSPWTTKGNDLYYGTGNIGIGDFSSNNINSNLHIKSSGVVQNIIESTDNNPILELKSGINSSKIEFNNSNQNLEFYVKNSKSLELFENKYILMDGDGFFRLRNDNFPTVSSIFGFHYVNTGNFGIRYVSNAPTVNTFHSFGSYSNNNKDTGTWNSDFEISTNLSGTTSLSVDGVNIFDDNTTLSSGVVNSSLTSVGTLSSLTMSGDINISGNNIINTGTLTLPTNTDTLVGRSTTDTLTNKTIDSSTNPIKATDMYCDTLNEYTVGGSGIHIKNNSWISEDKWFSFLNNISTSPPEFSIGMNNTNRHLYFSATGDNALHGFFRFGWWDVSVTTWNEALNIDSYTGDVDCNGNINVASTKNFTINSVTLKDVSETLTNKTIDASNNTISNIGDSQLISGINANKIHDGSVDNTEFSYLNGVSSNIQTQLNSKLSTNDFATLTNKNLSDSTCPFVDNLDNTKKVYFQISNITTGTSRTITIPDTDFVMSGVETTDALANKTIDGQDNTILNISDSSLSSGINANKIADGTVSNTEFQYINSLTSNVQTQINNILNGTTSFTNFNCDNININGNVISSSNTNGNINLIPNGTGIVECESDFHLNTNRVLTNRRTGWGAPTGTATRTTFNTTTVLLSGLAERVKALIDDLTTHGLIGA